MPIRVKKRSGKIVPLDINEIRQKTEPAVAGLKMVSKEELEGDAHLQFYDGITTREIQESLIQTAISKVDIDRPDWTFVAARLFLYDLKAEVALTVGAVKDNGYPTLEAYLKTGEENNRIVKGLRDKFILDILDNAIDADRDLQFTYLGLKTLADRYLIKNLSGRPIELPQHLFMGVSMFVAQKETDIKSVPKHMLEKYGFVAGMDEEKFARTMWAIMFYEMLSKFEVMAATPTLSNARTPRSQLSSCFVGATPDNIEGIFDAYKEQALLSKFGGGIGWDWNDVRSSGSSIDGHLNAAGGLIPFLKIENDVAIAVDQLGCVHKDSFVKVLKSVRTRDFEHDFRTEYEPLDLEEKDMIENLAGFASSFAFSYGNFNENFVSSLLYDYVFTGDPQRLQKVYNLSKDQYKKIIGRFKKINKGLPEGFLYLKDNKGYAISATGIVINIKNLRPLKRHVDRKGYVRVALGKLSVPVHKLVFQTFGTPPENTEYTIDHIDGNKLNNSIENLQAISNAKNISKGWEKSRQQRIEKSRLKKYLGGIAKLTGDRRGTKEIDILEVKEIVIPISEVRIGDLVKSFNIDSKKIEYKAVTSKYDIKVKKSDTVELIFEDGGSFITSAWHPTPKFIDSQLIYVRADRIAPGDVTISDSGEKRTVSKIKKGNETSVPDDRFFDLSVKDNQNYFCSSSETGEFHLIHNTRKGAIAVYIEPWHMDVENFLDLKKNSGEERQRAHDLFPAMWIPDLFMERVEKDEAWTLFSPDEVPGLHEAYGEEFRKLYEEYELKEGISKKIVSAKQLYKTMLREYFETGNPFLCFKDSANKTNPNSHAGVIRSSNLCVTGDTRLHTHLGMVRAKDLWEDGRKLITVYDKRVEGAGCGVEIAQSIEMHKTAENADIFEVKTSDGYKIKATEWHEFYVRRSKNIIKIPLKEIDPSTDLLLLQSGKGLFGHAGTYELGLVYGLVTGDGTFSLSRGKNPQLHIDLYNEEISLEPVVLEAIRRIHEQHGLKLKKQTTRKVIKHTEKSRKLRISSISIGKLLKNQYGVDKKRLEVPEFVFQGTEETVKGYLQGLFTSDATVAVTNKKTYSYSIQLASKSKKLLEEVQVLLSNFGIRAKLYKRRRTCRDNFYYTNKKGEKKTYKGQDIYRLDINGNNAITFLDEIGFLGIKAEKAKMLDQLRESIGLSRTRKKNEYFEVTIKSIKYIGKEDVYDTTQMKNHSLIFNGIVTGNCTEIYQNTRQNHYKMQITFDDGTVNTYEEDEVIITDEGVEKPAKRIYMTDTIDGKSVFFIEKVSDPGETAVCNLASINLSRVNTREDIERITPIAIRFLDNVVDLNFYPVRKAKETNLRSRAIGLGMMGEAQMIAEKGIRYGTQEHFETIDEVMEAISYNAIKASSDLAKEKGSYSNFEGSDWSKGVFPIDKANKEALRLTEGRRNYDWDALREKVKKDGMRNGYLMAVAPTSSISLIVGTSQANEPIFRKKYMEENLSGKIPVVAPGLSASTWEVYITAYDLDQRLLIKAGAVRQKWIDQGQSLNIFIKLDKKPAELGKMIYEIYLLAWKLGLKSTYYLRSQSPEELSDDEMVEDRSLECTSCQ